MGTSRRTRINPDGRSYRMPVIHDGDFRFEIQGGMPVLFGKIITFLGQLEEVKSLEEWAEDARRLKPNR